MPDNYGNNEQIRIVAQSVAQSTADATLQKFVEMHPEFSSPAGRPEIPPALKLWGTVGAALLTAAIIGVALWVVSSINTMQNTLARMDERQILLGPIQEKRFADLETRTTTTERRIDKMENRNAALN